MSPNMAQRFLQSLFSGCTIMHTIHDFLLQHKIKTNMKVWRLYIQHKMVRQYPQWSKHCGNSCSHCVKACIVLVWAFCIFTKQLLQGLVMVSYEALDTTFKYYQNFKMNVKRRDKFSFCLKYHSNKFITNRQSKKVTTSRSIKYLTINSKVFQVHLKHGTKVRYSISLTLKRMSMQ